MGQRSFPPFAFNSHLEVKSLDRDCLPPCAGTELNTARIGFPLGKCSLYLQCKQSLNISPFTSRVKQRQDSPANEKTLVQPLVTANGNAKHISHPLSGYVFGDFVHQQVFGYQSARYFDTGPSAKGIFLPVLLAFNVEHLCPLS